MIILKQLHIAFPFSFLISCSSFSNTVISSALVSPYNRHFIMLWRVLKPSSEPVENFGFGGPSYCGSFSQNTEASSFKRSPVTVAFFLFFYMLSHSNKSFPKSTQAGVRCLFTSSQVVPVSRCLNVLERDLEMVDCEGKCRNSWTNHSRTAFYDGLPPS